MRKDWPQAGIKGVYRAGDCLAPRYIADAVFDGHRIGREICSEYPQEPLPALREQSLWRQ
jgi:dimethylamine/trimethylamine dehydrogenase